MMSSSTHKQLMSSSAHKYAMNSSAYKQKTSFSTHVPTMSSSAHKLANMATNRVKLQENNQCRKNRFLLIEAIKYKKKKQKKKEILISSKALCVSSSAQLSPLLSKHS